MKKTYRSFLLQDIDDALSELERKIEEEGYDQYEPGFDADFREISKDVQSLTSDDFLMDKDVDADIFHRRLERVKRKLGTFEDEAELGIMFPNRDDGDDDEGHDPYD